MQAYVLSSSVTAYYWTGLLSVVEREFMQYAETRRESHELETRFKDLLAECALQVHAECGPQAAVAFSENMYIDQGLILVFKDGIK